MHALVAIPSRWPRLRRLDRMVIVVVVATVVGVTYHRLPPGICFGDSGGLQLAALTLGITHPPGYPGYATVGYIASHIPGIDSVRAVTLAYWLSGLTAVALCVLMQIRLGVGAGVSGAVALALTSRSEFWSSLLAPEVYMPSLALVAGAAYLLFRYEALQTRRDLLAAAALYGFALANRPPVLFALPFFLIAWWASRSSRDWCWRAAIKDFGLVMVCALVPCLYSLGYLWYRDAPQTPYNYIEQYNAETRELPDYDDGAGAKLERIFWHAGAKQFRSSMGNSWSGVRSKFRWLRNQLLPNRPVALMIASVAAAVGVLLVYSRSRSATWLLTGMIAGSLMFVSAYRVYGQAADLLPLLYSTAVFAGVFLSPLLPRESGRIRQGLSLTLLVVMMVATLVDSDDRPNTGAAMDATSFLAKVDMATLPRDAVVCTGWGQATPLWYARKVETHRDDITIINALDTSWLSMTATMRDRPLFTTDEPPHWQGYKAAPIRNLWRIKRVGNLHPDADDQSAPAQNIGPPRPKNR